MIKNLGRIKIIGKDFCDLREGKEIGIITITSKEDEKKAIELSRKFEYLIVTCKEVIPLENLLAQSSGKIIARVKNAQEANIALNVLERGVDGILISPEDVSEIRKTKEILEKANLVKIDLVEAKITQIRNVSNVGDRVCVDTIALMQEGEGMLVGNNSNGFFLVQAECIANPFIEPRPFRVNAGAVHLYTLSSEGKTRYLAELSNNDEVLIVNTEGVGKVTSVGRTKTERRPLIFVEAVSQDQKIRVFLQNAETINLIGKDRKPISIAQLKEGDVVLVHIGKKAGRHLGTAIEETIIEK